VDELDRSAGERLSSPPKAVRWLDLDWPRAVPETARHGITREHRQQLGTHLPHLADVLAQAV
jgi:hypothetical protein